VIRRQDGPAARRRETGRWPPTAAPGTARASCSAAAPYKVNTEWHVLMARITTDLRRGSHSRRRRAARGAARAIAGRAAPPAPAAAVPYFSHSHASSATLAFSLLPYASRASSASMKFIDGQNARRAVGHELQCRRLYLERSALRERQRQLGRRFCGAAAGTAGSTTRPVYELSTRRRISS
jgi:hypothetical protein